MTGRLHICSTAVALPQLSAPEGRGEKSAFGKVLLLRLYTLAQKIVGLKIFGPLKHLECCDG